MRISVVRNGEEWGGASVTSGGGILSNDNSDLASRAALFRLEADALRQRAGATNETVVRAQYFKLADHWTMLAAGLELQLLAQLTGPRQTL